MTANASATGTPAGHAPRIEPPLARERVQALTSGAAQSAGVRLEVPGVVGLLTIRADPDVVPLARAFEDVLGLGVPARLSSVTDGTRRVRWMSPDEWLLSCPIDDVATLETRLRAALDGERGASVTEVSGGWCVLVVGGPRARDALAACVPIDLDPRAFGPDRVASTTFAKTGATLANLGDGRIEIVCRRSFADYVARVLASVSREHGLALADDGSER